MRRLVAAAAVLAAAAACASPLTPARVEASFAPTFGALYALQQSQQGRTLDPSALLPRATCRRAGVDSSGPGEDWTCTVVYLDTQTSFTQSFELQVKPDGCWRAEAPPVAQPAVRTDPLTGVTRTNPLAEFDGCLDTSWR